MADVYDGYGEFPGAPISPTRPPSLRKRQSMQLIELEARLDQLASENRLLAAAKINAELALDEEKLFEPRAFSGVVSRRRRSNVQRQESSSLSDPALEEERLFIVQEHRGPPPSSEGPQSNQGPTVHELTEDNGWVQVPVKVGENDVDNSVLTRLEKVRQSLQDDGQKNLPLTEVDYANIALHLVREKKPESAKRPRTYCILWAMDRLDYMDSFVSENIHDFSLPHSTATLPRSTMKTRREKDAFLYSQSKFMSQPEDFERNPLTHKHFGEQEDEDEEGGADSYYKFIRKLGHGNYGEVDLVEESVTGRTLARKKIARGRNHTEDKKIVSEFRIELRALKKLQHVHLVELVGSYTDMDYIGLLMLPIAQYNLEEYLKEIADKDDRAKRTEEQNEKRLQTLCRSYGCLSSALGYLHDNQIRHRDLKPSNVLVHGTNVLLTDFGTAQEWQDGGKSTTMNVSAVNTPAYCSPEQADQQPRNRKSDIWSLGCVFLEITTVYAGLSVEGDMYPFFDKRGTGSRFIRNNPVATAAYVKHLQGLGHEEVIRLTDLIMKMIRVRPQERPLADQVLNNVLAINGGHFGCELCLISGAMRRLRRMGQNHELVKHSGARLLETAVYPSLLPSFVRSATVMGAVKMVRFSYSNEDTKDEEGRESWRPEMPLSRCYAPSLHHTSPLSRNAPQQQRWFGKPIAYSATPRKDTIQNTS